MKIINKTIKSVGSVQHYIYVFFLISALLRFYSNTFYLSALQNSQTLYKIIDSFVNDDDLAVDAALLEVK